MKRWIAFITVISATLGTFGCSTCCSPHDYDYPTFGGKHQRVDARYGRVGSVFSDPNASQGGLDADSNLAPMTKPFVPRKDNLESIEPLDGVPDIQGQESLPVPPNTDENGPTASRLQKSPPLRSY